MNVSCPVIPNGTPARTIQLPDVRRVRPLQFRNPTASRTLSNNWMNVSGSRLAVQAVIRCCGRSFVQRLSPNAATLSIAFYRLSSRFACASKIGMAQRMNFLPLFLAAAFNVCQSSSDTRPSCLAWLGLYAPRSVAGRPRLLFTATPPIQVHGSVPLPAAQAVRLASRQARSGRRFQPSQEPAYTGTPTRLSSCLTRTAGRLPPQ